MRSKIIIFICALLIFVAPVLKAAILKNTASTQKTTKHPVSKNTSKSLNIKKPLSRKKRADKKELGSKKSKQGKQLVWKNRPVKTLAKKNRTRLDVDDTTKMLAPPEEVVINAIAQARDHVKIQQVSAIESTLYAPRVQSTGALVINEHSGQIIYEKNAHFIAPIASISKVMTAMVVLDAHLPMNELLTVNEEDIDRLKKTSSRLSVGTQLTRAEMLLLALMSSENRAASALSRHYPGGQAAFIQAMNQKAQQLGMSQTHFNDPTGLNKGNISTPHDLSLMIAAAHQYSEIHQFTTSIQYAFISNVTGNELVFRNTNPLTSNNDWNIGISKTGYINEAGKCLVMQATINNAPIVIILLDSSGKQTRVLDAQLIKTWMESDPAAQLNAG